MLRVWTDIIVTLTTCERNNRLLRRTARTIGSLLCIQFNKKILFNYKRDFEEKGSLRKAPELCTLLKEFCIQLNLSCITIEDDS